MQIGVVFPQTEIGADAAAVRAYATAVTDLGYRHLLAYDHVLGADPQAHPGWRGPYDVDTTFHEPLVLYGFLAGIVPLELVTGVLILPQRQTALVAKQAAEVDLLSGGKFRLGVGIGWNAVEYEALGEDFTTRGRRLTEQIQLMRRLWTERTVTHRGRYEQVTGAGLAPLPVQRPIPVWIGATRPPALRRAGRLADGWFPQVEPGPALAEAISIVHGAAADAGRDPGELGMDGRVALGPQGADEVAVGAAAWAQAGATHLSVSTMDAGLGGVDGHIAALAEIAGVLSLART